MPRAIATEFVPADVTGRLLETQCQIIHLQASCVTETHMRAMRDEGIEFAVATINDADEARRFLAGGATSVLTDHPDLLG